MPSDGLEGFESFLRDHKRMLINTSLMVEEEIYTSLQDHDLAIHPDSIGAEKKLASDTQGVLNTWAMMSKVARWMSLAK